MKFEYKIKHICTYYEDTEDMINELGQNGWELVCSYAWHNAWLIFKREIKGRKNATL